MTNTYMRGSILRNALATQRLRKILAIERQTVNFTSVNLILLILTHFLCVLWPSRHIFMSNFFWLEIFSVQ